MPRAVLAGPSVVRCISVLHQSAVRTVLGIVVRGLWQANDSVVSQNVLRNSNTFPCIMLFYGKSIIQGTSIFIDTSFRQELRKSASNRAMRNEFYTPVCEKT